jgi:hypothetical protein
MHILVVERELKIDFGFVASDGLWAYGKSKHGNGDSKIYVDQKFQQLEKKVARLSQRSFN